MSGSAPQPAGSHAAPRRLAAPGAPGRRLEIDLPTRESTLVVLVAGLLVVGWAAGAALGNAAAPLFALPAVLVAAGRLGPGWVALVALAGAAVTGPLEPTSTGPHRVAGWVVAAVLLQVAGLLEQQVLRRWREADQRVFDLLQEQRERDRAAADERDSLTRELRRRDETDPLTDLASRALFSALTGQAVAGAAASGSGAAVLMVDLVEFSAVNDRFGPAVGDEVLRAVAGRMRGALRETDVVSRFGGDEFAVLLPDQTTEGARTVADRVLGAFAEPFGVSVGRVPVRARAGLALLVPRLEPAETAPGQHALELLRRADAALHLSKASRDELCVFAPDAEQTTLERVALEADLRLGLEDGQFFLLYQPVVGCRSGRVEGVEALVRWRHPERGVVPPDRFIPTAERSGLIVPLGLWVLGEACRQLRVWRENHGQTSFVMAVNMSARQLAEPGIVEAVQDVLYRAAVDPRCVKLEITESLLVDDSDAAVATLWQLRGLGVKLSVDDFGTGYSSLSRLCELPIDEMKIDRSFVSRIGADTGATDTVVTAAVAMGHGLGLSVVAEGVETDGQRTFLADVGCDHLQGYLLSRPVPADEVTALLDRPLFGVDAYPQAPTPRVTEEEQGMAVPAVLPSLAASPRRSAQPPARVGLLYQPNQPG